MDVDALRKHAGLKPLPTTNGPAEPAEPVIEIDRTGFMDPDVRRGTPVFDGKHGLPGGSAIKDSRPGGELGAAKRLEQASKDILQGQVKRTRRKDYR